MKKTVLFLINGFGIESKKSYNIYSSELMPNLDDLTRRYMFASLSSDVGNLKDGYKLFSTGRKDAITYDFMEEKIETKELINNPKILQLQEEVTKLGNNLHIFYGLENEASYFHLRDFLNEFKTKIPNTKIFLHVYMTQKEITSYKEINRIITRMTYEFNDNIQMSLVIGKNILGLSKNDPKLIDFVRILTKGFCESWNEVEKKLTIFYENGDLPINAKPFCIHGDFKINNNDTLFFFNYDNVNCSDFIKELDQTRLFSANGEKTNSINIYSLFPIVAERPIIALYDYPVSESCLSQKLKEINAKCLIATRNDSFQFINYYAQGFRNINSENVGFMDGTDEVMFNSTTLNTIINTYPYDLFIFNYFIDDFTDIENLKTKLSNIDKVLGDIYKNCTANNFTLMISSLYGMFRSMEINDEKEKIDFSQQVPFIIADDMISKVKNTISYGNVYGVLNTAIKNINEASTCNSLLKKKGILSSLLMKK